MNGTKPIYKNQGNIVPLHDRTRSFNFSHNVRRNKTNRYNPRRYCLKHTEGIRKRLLYSCEENNSMVKSSSIFLQPIGANWIKVVSTQARIPGNVINYKRQSPILVHTQSISQLCLTALLHIYNYNRVFSHYHCFIEINICGITYLEDPFKRSAKTK